MGGCPGNGSAQENDNRLQWQRPLPFHCPLASAYVLASLKPWELGMEALPTMVAEPLGPGVGKSGVLGELGPHLHTCSRVLCCPAQSSASPAGEASLCS